MSGINLKKIVGTTAILLAVTAVYFIVSLFGKADSDSDGPHLFFEKDAIAKINIQTTGRKIQKTTDHISYQKSQLTEIEVPIPNGKKSFFIKRKSQHTLAPDKYDNPSRTFVISDVEGDFEYLANILRGNKIIDKNYNWNYGDSHLVIVGDVFDRGTSVTECLWLIYKLENQATQQGGHVHLILGNHEIMALQGDHRYIARKYRKIAKFLNLEYKDFFSPKTELGKWLRTKNAIEKIGNSLFVHGGISPEIAQTNLSITEINNIIRTQINPNLGFSDLDHTKLILGTKGPLWYRGYIEKPIPQSEIEKITTAYDVKDIVIGHTLVDNVTSMYNNHVFAVDVKRNSKKYTALLIENDEHYSVELDEFKTKL